MDWSLLTAAEASGFDVMITSDPNIRYQQNMSGRNLALVVLDTNHWPTIGGNLSSLVAAVLKATPGSYQTIIMPKPPRRRRPHIRSNEP